MHGEGRVVLILMSWVICSWQPPSSSSSYKDTQIQEYTDRNTRIHSYQIQRHSDTKYKDTQIPNTRTHKANYEDTQIPNTQTQKCQILSTLSDYMLHIRCQKQNVGVCLTLVGYNCPWFPQYLLAVSLAIKQIRPADIFLRILQVSNPSFVTEKRPRPPKFQSGGE